MSDLDRLETAKLPENKDMVRAMKSSFKMTKQRCYNPKCRDYKYYGGRGITIQQSWLDCFDNFLADMGIRPEGLTLERKDNDGPYSADNCLWASREKQTSNRRITRTLTYKGETKTWVEWSEITGIDYHTIKARVNILKYSPEETLTKPVLCGGKLEGRYYRPIVRRKMSEIVPRGYDHKFTKIDRGQAQTIRDKFSIGVTKAALAREYKVSSCTISKVIYKKEAYSD